jgi:hypothetical protein
MNMYHRIREHCFGWHGHPLPLGDHANLRSTGPRHSKAWPCHPAASAILLILLAADTLVAAEKAPEPQWGPPSGGLTLSLSMDGDATVGGPLKIKVALKSAAGQTVALPPAKEIYGWLLVVQGTGDSRKAFYGERLPVFAATADWPSELAADKTLTSTPADAGAGAAYVSEDAKKLLAAYVAAGQRPAPEKAAEDLPKSAGPLSKVLAPGRAMAKFTLCLPRAAEAPLILTSNSVDFVIAPPDFKSLSPEARQAFTADLMKQFDRDAWSGREAHNTAVRLGDDALPAILAAAFEKDRPEHARLWLATTLADIRDPRSAASLVKLLDDTSEGVRNVVAFHGSKQQNQDLDKAIIAKAKGGQPGLAAWAILGFMVHRGESPEELIKAGLESDDPRARSAAAETLARHASDDNVARLVLLLADKDERVRGTAAAILGNSGVKTPTVIGGLVKALDLPGESARQRAAAALSTLTGRAVPYDPKADEAARAKSIADWKAWWAAAGKPQP